MALDLEAVKDEFLRQCGPCDYGLAYPCNCPSSDYRPTMMRLIVRIEDLERELRLLRQHTAGCERCQQVADHDRDKAAENR